MTRDEWKAEAERRFGSDAMEWRFKCPVCGRVTSVREWHEAGAPEGAVAFSCVGRWQGGPCTYAGGGLFRLNPVVVTDAGVVHHVFAFADNPR